MVSYTEAMSDAGVKPKRSGMRPEDKLQIRVAKWLEIALPPSVLWSGVGHEKKQSLRAGAIQKAKGIRRGLSDLMFWHRGVFLGIEIKAGKNTETTEQEKFGLALEANGFRYAVCRSEKEVEVVLKRWEFPVRWPAPEPFAAPTVTKPKRASKPRTRKLTAGEARAQERVRSRTMF